MTTKWRSTQDSRLSTSQACDPNMKWMNLQYDSRCGDSLYFCNGAWSNLRTDRGLAMRQHLPRSMGFIYQNAMIGVISMHTHETGFFPATGTQEFPAKCTYHTPNATLQLTKPLHSEGKSFSPKTALTPGTVFPRLTEAWDMTPVFTVPASCGGRASKLHAW